MLSISSEPIQTYLHTIRSKETQKQYLIYLEYFQEWYNNQKIDGLLQLDNKVIEKIIIDYIIFMKKEKRLSASSIKGRISPIVSFFELHDVSLNKTRIKKFYPEHVKTVKDKAYTREDIQKMLQYAPFRTKVLILIYSSTGMRREAPIGLKLKHLEKAKTNQGIELYKFTLYENTPDEYYTYCTTECTGAIDQYIEKKKNGRRANNPRFISNKKRLRF